MNVLFYALSRSALLKKLASKYGMKTRESFARRFIAGERIDYDNVNRDSAAFLDRVLDSMCLLHDW